MELTMNDRTTRNGAKRNFLKRLVRHRFTIEYVCGGIFSKTNDEEEAIRMSFFDEVIVTDNKQNQRIFDGRHLPNNPL